MAGLADFNKDGQQDVLWFDTYTGWLNAAFLDGSGMFHQIGRRYVNWQCPNACNQVWRPIAVADVNGDGNTDVLWYHPNSGEVSAWLLNGDMNVIGTHPLTWRCGVSSQCAGNWGPIGMIDIDSNGIPDVGWWNPTTGEIGFWLLDVHGTVLGDLRLDWRCGTGCANTWHPVGFVSPVGL